MKTTSKLIGIILLLTVILVAFKLTVNPVGPHGGKVKTSGIYNIEMKNSYPNLYVFLFDSRLRPISNKGILCESKFIFADSSSSVSPVKPFGGRWIFYEVRFPQIQFMQN